MPDADRLALDPGIEPEEFGAVGATGASGGAVGAEYDTGVVGVSAGALKSAEEGAVVTTRKSDRYRR